MATDPQHALREHVLYLLRGGGAHLSFGCVVMHNRDIASWFDDVPIGTMVVIF